MTCRGWYWTPPSHQGNGSGRPKKPRPRYSLKSPPTQRKTPYGWMTVGSPLHRFSVAPGERVLPWGYLCRGNETRPPPVRNRPDLGSDIFRTDTLAGLGFCKRRLGGLAYGMPLVAPGLRQLGRDPSVTGFFLFRTRTRSPSERADLSPEGIGVQLLRPSADRECAPVAASAALPSTGNKPPGSPVAGVPPSARPRSGRTLSAPEFRAIPIRRRIRLACFPHIRWNPV